MTLASGLTAHESFVQDNLVAGDLPTVTRKGTIGGAAPRLRGDVLGEITASPGNYLLSLSAAVDGTEVPSAILAEDIDVTGGDLEQIIYDAGHFNEDAINLGTAHTVASVRDGLRDKGIHLSANLPA